MTPPLPNTGRQANGTPTTIQGEIRLYIYRFWLDVKYLSGEHECSLFFYKLSYCALTDWTFQGEQVQLIECDNQRGLPPLLWALFVTPTLQPALILSLWSFKPLWLSRSSRYAWPAGSFDTWDICKSDEALLQLSIHVIVKCNKQSDSKCQDWLWPCPGLVTGTHVAGKNLSLVKASPTPPQMLTIRVLHLDIRH